MAGSNEREWKQQKQRNNGRNETMDGMDGMEGRTEDGSGEVIDLIVVYVSNMKGMI